MAEYTQYLGFWTPGLLEIIIILLVLVPFWKICSKAGRSPWLSLPIILPLVNIVFLWWLGFSRWPALPGSKIGNLD